MPSIVRIGPGIFGPSTPTREAKLYWTNGSGLSMWLVGTGGFSLLGCDCGDPGGTLLSGGEVSFWYEAITSTFPEPWPKADGPGYTKSPSSARKTPTEQRPK